MANTTFKSITTYPERINGTGIISRLIDGLGYRFFWATEGLREADYYYCPGNDCMTIAELIKHIWGLINWIHLSLSRRGYNEDRPKDISAEREHVLYLLHNLREEFDKLEDNQLDFIKIRNLPFWHIINGPLSDALTHVGQINSIRRLAGNPTKRCFVFTLQDPEISNQKRKTTRLNDWDE
ncbi:MAG: hypothetical protein ACFFBD_21595 [Candidatus Hodarchaeota archaeon]